MADWVYVLWCADCQEAVRNTVPAYVRHSSGRHKGAGWNGTLVPEGTVPATE